MWYLLPFDTNLRGFHAPFSYLFVYAQRQLKGVQNVYKVVSERLFTTSLTDYLDCNRECSKRSQPTCILF